MRTQAADASPLSPPVPATVGAGARWARLPGAAAALAIAQMARRAPGLVLAVLPDMPATAQLSAELAFFLGDELPVLRFPDWEILPYDLFSPLPELISERLFTLHCLPRTVRGVLAVPVGTLLQRLPPCAYVDQHSLVLACGERFDLEHASVRLEQAGYRRVSQVIDHGEFAVRGSLLDVFPMGSTTPLRIDLFDDEIDSIRTFDPDSQRSRERLEQVRLLPAREFPLTESAIAGFRQRWRATFAGDPKLSSIYREVSAGRVPGGLEFYLPLFFDTTATLFDYLPANTLVCEAAGAQTAAAEFLAGVAARYESLRHDTDRPLLPPEQLYLSAAELSARFAHLPGVRWQAEDFAPDAAPCAEPRPAPPTARRRENAAGHKPTSPALRFTAALPPPLALEARAKDPAAALRAFLTDDSPLPGSPATGDRVQRRVLLVASSAGRRVQLDEQLRGYGLQAAPVASWAEFCAGTMPLALTVAELERPLWLAEGLALLTEAQLYGERVRQERRRSKARDSEAIVRNLTELRPGAPVVHEEHGIGRFLGLQTLTIGGVEGEFLTLEYAGGDKLYVPVSALHRVARYTGAAPETAPLHRLGSDQWERAKRKAAQQALDVAAELLDIYARRAARPGHAFSAPGADYAAFAAAFPFEETPDQQRAIDAVLADLAAPKPMDRVICGDVGFGKTEVAMRAAFVVVSGGRQVAVLVPTTLLAQQHYQTFSDRFADWPVRIANLSRFRAAAEQTRIAAGLADGSIDIVIGTHKLLDSSLRFKNLGLVVIDEEHRFGVRHKERLKHLRSEVDVLTLTATPIPRTLNLAMSGLRDLSLIATPPVARHPIKTFVATWSDALIQEGCLRELRRGGQIYFLHNEVETIDKIARALAALVPMARIEIAHGQMRARELERTMRDFYHRRFDLLVCTTIIESGIDVPNANTIFIHRADKLGLAQLHQLRGRVGRSHHRAYAYLLVPPAQAMTEDAKKRLEAIAALEDLGAGFTLATHDLEIRGAGELLGEAQSGQIHEVGFALYMELLERAVAALQAGRTPALDRPLDHGPEIDLGVTARLPEDYLPDPHERLVLYKRIASAADVAELRELKVEMIDRFGLLPEAAQHLFTIAELKLAIAPLGIRKVEAGAQGGRLLFGEQPAIDHARLVHLLQTQPRQFTLDRTRGALRFVQALPDAAARCAAIRSLIEQLRPALPADA